MVEILGEIYGYLFETVTTNGGLGTIANWEQHIIPIEFNKPAEELSEIMGEVLPPETQFSRHYRGMPRVIVPTLKSIVYGGELLNLRVIVLDRKSPRRAELFWRSIGQDDFRSKNLTHISPWSVYSGVSRGKRGF